MAKLIPITKLVRSRQSDVLGRNWTNRYSKWHICHSETPSFDKKQIYISTACNVLWSTMSNGVTPEKPGNLDWLEFADVAEVPADQICRKCTKGLIVEN